MFWYRRQKRVLVSDIDDCMVDFFPDLAKYHNQQYGTAITISDFTSYSFWEPMGCDVEEGRRRCMEFFMSPYASMVQPLPDAQEVIGLLADEFRLINITGRPFPCLDSTQRLIDRLFPNCIEQIICTSSVFPGARGPRKGEACQSVEAFAIIDDNQHYEQECREAGTEFLLFGEYPWNEQSTLPRLRDWRAVAEHFFKAGS